MPTIHQQDGFRLVIYTKDHTPAHVHCKRGAARVVVNLPTDLNDATLRQFNRHCHHNDLADAVRIVNEISEKLWTAWRQIHGQ